MSEELTDVVTQDFNVALGPLAPLIGIWEGDSGIDVSRIKSKETITRFREKTVFEPLGPVKNGPQTLYGLRYSTTVWQIGEVDAFHEEIGYWLWDGGRKQIMRCFTIPRGVLINAGGTAEADSKNFHLCAESGSETYGILSNKYLDETYKTKKYLLDFVINDDSSFSYKQDTQLWIPINKAIFHHTDKNTLLKIAE